MQTGRITVPLDTEDARALRQMAQADCRHPREELRFLLREEARRRGLTNPSGDAEYRLLPGHSVSMDEEETDG